MRRALTYTVREVTPYINWIYYFHAWGMEPRFASIAGIHDCPSCRAGWIASFHMSERAKAQEAVKLYQEAVEQLKQLYSTRAAYLDEHFADLKEGCVN